MHHTATDPLIQEFDELVTKLRQPFAEIVGHTMTAAGRVPIKTNRDGLLAELRQAVIGGIGSHEGAAQVGTRLPMNTNARELYDSIESSISIRYVLLLDSPVFMYPEQTIFHWWVAVNERYRTGQLTEKELKNHVAAARKWVTSIETFFNPPRERELTSPCPRCGDVYSWVVVDGDARRRRALAISFNEDSMTSSLLVFGAECRSCWFRWNGSAGVEALAVEVGIKFTTEADDAA